MRKLSLTVMVVMAVVLVAAAAMAQTTTIITRDATVKGDSVRGPLVAGIIESNFADSKATVIPDNTLGDYVVVTGPGGADKIHFSRKLVGELQQLAKNPKAGGLINVCQVQGKQLQKIMGPMRATLEPMVRMESVSRCDQRGGCFGKVLTGSYQTLRPYNGIRMVSNSGNHKYPENSLSFKVEYHRAGLTGWTYGTNWGPTIVLRNITMENPINLLVANGSLVVDYLRRVSALKQGQTGNEGDSCYEVVILRDGTIYKDESPVEAPFCRQ